MTLVEKAMAYAEKRLRTAYPNMTLSRLDKAVDLFDTYDMAQAYEDGATEALQSQWKSTKDEIPDGNVKMLYLLRDGRLSIGYFVNDDYQQFWMPIPEPPVKGGEK